MIEFSGLLLLCEKLDNGNGELSMTRDCECAASVGDPNRGGCNVVREICLRDRFLDRLEVEADCLVRCHRAMYSDEHFLATQKYGVDQGC